MGNLWSLIFDVNRLDAWISVIGTFFGTLLAGIISAVIALWAFKKQARSQLLQEHQNREKAIQIIEELVELAIGSLIFIEPGPTGICSPRSFNNVELKKLKAVNMELSNIPNDIITLDINSSFQNIRILLRILEIEIEKALSLDTVSDEVLSKELNKVQILERVLKIVEHLKKFSKKDYLDGLYNDLKKEVMEKKKTA